MQLGYACINLSIPEYTTNRTMRKATFNQKGIDYVSDLTLQNVSDIIHILKWNRLNGINFFRLSSCLIPWGDKLDITKLKDYKAIAYELKLAGQYAIDNGIRITTHPGPFCILSSPNDAVVQSAIDDLEMHGKVFDLTEFYNEHPGGWEVIEDNAGKDGTSAYEEGSHGMESVRDLKKYYVGEYEGKKLSLQEKKKEVAKEQLQKIK